MGKDLQIKRKKEVKFSNNQYLPTYVINQPGTSGIFLSEQTIHESLVLFSQNESTLARQQPAISQINMRNITHLWTAFHGDHNLSQLSLISYKAGTKRIGMAPRPQAVLQNKSPNVDRENHRNARAERRGETNFLRWFRDKDVLNDDSSPTTAAKQGLAFLIRAPQSTANQCSLLTFFVCLLWCA
jgi:hypothetical protein